MLVTVKAYETYWDVDIDLEDSDCYTICVRGSDEDLTSLLKEDVEADIIQEALIEIRASE